MIEKLIKKFELGGVPNDPFYGTRFTEEEHSRYLRKLNERAIEFTKNKKLDSEFETFCQLLDYNSVEYLIVGGYAIAFYGFDRKIGDLDIWVKPCHNNLEKLSQVFQSCGFDESCLKEINLNASNTVIQLGKPPVRVDLLLGLPYMDFDDCFNRSQTSIYNFQRLNFIGLEDLKTSKVLGGRKKDLRDLEILNDKTIT